MTNYMKVLGEVFETSHTALIRHARGNVAVTCGTSVDAEDVLHRAIEKVAGAIHSGAYAEGRAKHVANGVIMTEAEAMARYLSTSITSSAKDWFGARKVRSKDVSLDQTNAEGEAYEVAIPCPAPEANLESSYDAKEVRATLQAEVRATLQGMLDAPEVPVKQRLALEALMAHYMGGVPLKAIAEARGVSVNTIKGEVDRMRDTLRRKLRDVAPV